MNTEDIFRKYGRKLDEEVANADDFNSQETSKEYATFKQEMMPALSRYERYCQGLGNFLKLKVAEKDRIKIQKQQEKKKIMKKFKPKNSTQFKTGIQFNHDLNSFLNPF